MGAAYLAALFLLLQTPPAPPANPAIATFEVNLQWDANPETDLAGYKLYWGNSSRTYGPPLPLGKVTTGKVTGLTTPNNYYFAVTAFNTSGLESAYSNEVVLMPGPPGSQGPAGPIGPAGPAGATYDPGPILQLIAANVTSTTATITWVTKQDCSGTAFYGTAEPLTKSVVSNNLGTTDHLSLLTGLLARTHYLYRVTGVCAGVSIQSGIRSFNTK